MKLKTQKLILHFLKEYKKVYDHSKDRDSFFEDFFSKDELKEIIQHIYGDTCFNSNHEEEDFSEKELFSLIKHDSFFLSYLIEKIEMELAAFPNFSQNEVDAVFQKASLYSHYLASKQVELWDEYDRNNYRSILRKHGFTQKVFGIFLAEVKEEDKYLVTSPPKTFFDSKEDAEKEIKAMVEKGEFKEHELKIMTLWKLIHVDINLKNPST